jgi:large conductance mechanosensitive channel
MTERKVSIKKLKSMSSNAREEASEFWQDFRSFAFKGDVLDLAVGVVIGTAFNKIVQSLTNDVIMPIFGAVIGNSAFSDLYINLSNDQYANLSDATAAGAPVIKYGLFITNILDFFIIALSLYVVIRFVLRKRKEEKLEEAKK